MTDSDLQINFVADASGVVQGTNQAKSAVDDFGAKIQGMAGTFGTLGDKLKSGLEGFQSFAKGLSAAGGEGAAAGEGLAALAEAGEGVAGVAVAIGQVALEAAAAIAEWAARTANSSTASAEARATATALNTAMKEAQSTFGQVGDILATAFAPAMTEVVKDLKGMAEAFIDNYKHGGEAKFAIDALVIGVKGLVTAIDGIITWNALLWDAWKAVWGGIVGVVEGAFKAVGDDAQAVGRVFNDLGGLIKAALSGNVTAGVAALRSLLKDATDAAKQLSAPLGDIVKNTLTGATAGVDAIVGDFTAAAQRLEARTGPADTSADRDGSGPAATTAGNPAGGQQNSVGGGSRTPKTSDASACDCDPAAAEACATQTQADQNGITLEGANTRTGILVDANALATNSNQAVTADFVQGKQTEVSAAVAGDNRIQVSATTTARKITNENSQALKQFETSLNGVVSAFSKGLSQMIVGGKSFSQVMRSVGQQILNDLFRVVDGMVDTWARGVTENLLASTEGQALLKALGLKDLAQQILVDTQKTANVAASQAAQQTAVASSLAAQKLQVAMQMPALIGLAGAGGVASMAAAPWPLDMSAPAFGSAMAAAAASWGAAASAAGGFDIPAGLNPVTQLHAQEMVLPARLANPMRDMLASFAAGGATGSASGAGEVHNHTHNWSVTAMDGPSVERFLRTHGDRMVKVLNERVRANAGVALGYAR